MMEDLRRRCPQEAFDTAQARRAPASTRVAAGSPRRLCAGREATVTDDEREEIDQVLADLEAEEADQEAERGYAPPPLSRAIARLRRLTGPTAGSAASR